MKIFWIPDTQCKPKVKMNHLRAAGNYIADKKPDVVIHAGDHWDMQSLSAYDKGTILAEGTRYQNDIEAGYDGMMELHEGMTSAKNYYPKKYFLIGNHEERIARHVKNNPALEGKLSYGDLKLDHWGWEMLDYLEILKVGGVHFSHYFYNPMTGKPYSGKCSQRLNNLGFSFVQGHQQGLDVAMKHLSNGKTLRGLVAGSFYQHDEHYKGPQGNHHWRGCLMLHEVKDGNYGLMELSMSYLLKEWL